MPATALGSRTASGRFPLWLLVLVLLSAVMHSLIRTQLASTLHVALQPSSTTAVLEYISGASAADSSASARVSLVLARAVQRSGAAEPSVRSPVAASSTAPVPAISVEASVPPPPSPPPPAAATAATAVVAATSTSTVVAATSTSTVAATTATTVAAATAAAGPGGAGGAAARSAGPIATTSEAACATAMASCAACDLRLLHWNLQQRVANAAATQQLSAVLAFARAHRYDVVSLNELALEQAQVEALGGTLGYSSVALYRGRSGTSLGFVSMRPLQPVAPRAQDGPGDPSIGHGLLCVRMGGGNERAGCPALCATHLTAEGERRRQQEVGALLRLLGAQRAVLVGTLNMLSPLDGADGGGDAAAAAAAALEQLRASRKLAAKFLDVGLQPAVRGMRRLLGAGLRDVAFGSGAARATLAATEAEPALRVDYVLGSASYMEGCAVGNALRAAPLANAELASPGTAATPGGVSPANATATRGAVVRHWPLQLLLGRAAAEAATLAAASGGAAPPRCADVEARQRREAALATAEPPPPPPMSAAAAAAAAAAAGTAKPAAPRAAAAAGGGGTFNVKEAWASGGLDDAQPTESHMPGGVPKSGAAGATCAALGEAEALPLAKLRDAMRTPHFMQRCQARSGLLELLGLRRRLSSCAVVGGSGILAQRPRGAEIDAAEAIFRVNNCPVRGFEHMVGARTTFRFLNSPRSLKWAKEVKERQAAKGKHARSVAPPELEDNQHVLIWGSTETRDRLRSSLPSNASIERADTSFRKHCAQKAFWADAEVAKHKESGARLFEITFGFEAVAHALFACERVSIYGFYLDDADAKRQTNAKGSDAMAVAYHYYENQTYDKSAKDPWRPWTYSYHNFHLEHKKYRQLNSACWLRVVQ